MINGLCHGMQFGMPVREELMTVRVGCMWMQAMPAKPWREFQNVHITACIGMLCRSIVK